MNAVMTDDADAQMQSGGPTHMLGQSFGVPL
jgi:hypothetical protein